MKVRKVAAASQRIALLLLAPFVLAAECEDPPPMDDFGDIGESPLIQESLVVLEIDVPEVGWVPMIVPQEGVERFARMYCAGERQSTSDTTICGTAEADPLMEYDDLSELAGATQQECTEALCLQRNETCAGMLLEEAARLPVAREYEPGTRLDIHLTDLLLVPEAIIETVLAAAGAPVTQRTTSKIRFQPMQASSKAATLRGALKRYRDAFVLAHAMHDPWVTDPTEGTAATCLETFATADPPEFKQSSDGSTLSWNDAYYGGFLQTLERYRDTLDRTVEAMRDSAQAQVDGNRVAQAEIATLWNGKADSALSIAKLIGWGESDAPGGPPQHMVQGGGLSENQQPAAKIGPLGLPVCPPTSNNESAQSVASYMFPKGFKFTSTDFAGEAAAFETAITGVEISKEDLMLKLNASDKDFAFAAYSQWKKAELTGSYMLPKDSLAGGVITYHNTIGQPEPLPQAVFASHFTGVAAGQTAGKMFGSGQASYSAGGAVRTLDMVKQTVAALEAAVGSANVNQKVQNPLFDAKQGLEQLVGGWRLEFHIGFEHTQDPGAVEQMRISIHGVSGTPETPSEQFFLVQGTKGLKCAVNGTIDGAACEPSKYLVHMNTLPSVTFSSGPDPRMTDMQGRGFMHADISSLPQPDEPNAPIQQAYGVYVLRKVGTSMEAFGGVVPSVGPMMLAVPTTPAEATWPSFGVTRQVMAPAGGSLDQVIQQAVTPNSEDCSKVQATCAGIAADIWPPLESEIVGEGVSSGAAFESSWRYWLSLARNAAMEADRLGEELIEQGLELEKKFDRAATELEDLCGSNADPDSCGLNQDPVVATLGDRDVCLWGAKGGGSDCDRSLLKDQYGGLACPYPLDDVEATPGNCQSKLSGFFDDFNKVEVTPVTTKLRIVSTGGSGPAEGACVKFAALRANDDPELDTKSGGAVDKKAARSEFIRKYIMKDFGVGFTTEVARSLSYEEEFADNYVLRYGKNAIVFDTRRPVPYAGNADVGAPCNIDEVDTGTGSSFWSRKLDCFRKDSDIACNSFNVGHESCGATITTRSNISHDTEHNPLRRRWAWGFGHLRRSMAVLGAITGQLDGNMTLARIFPVAFENFPWGGVIENTNAGRPCAPDNNDKEAMWVMHCTPAGRAEHRPFARCVPVKGFQGVGNDMVRRYTGRPVNVNGFIPNVLAYDETADYFDGVLGSHNTVGHWPVICLNGECKRASPPGAGPVMGDPQMPYCSITQFEDTTGEVGPVLTGIETGGTTWKENGDSSGLVGAGMAKPGAVRAPHSAWQDAVSKMWQDPGGNFCAQQGTGLVGAVWRALCLAPEASGGTDDPNAPNTWDNEKFMRFAVVPVPGQLLVPAADVQKWLSPLGKSDKSRFGQMLFDLRKGNVREGKAPFQYELNERNIFDALELACHASARARSGGSVKCDALTPETMGNDGLAKIAAALECYGNNMGRAAERFVVKVSPVLLTKLNKGEALPSGGGAGGQYLAKLGEQYAAIKRIGANYAKIRDAQIQLAIAVRTLAEIDEEDEATDKAAQAQKLATYFQGLAAAMSTVASANPFAAGAAVAAAGAQMTATAYSIKAIAYQAQATDAQLEQKRLDLFARMQKELAAGREAADDLVLALNALNLATKDIEIIHKKALKAVAASSLADYVGDKTDDPQWLNTVERRIYNTRLLRYERAFERAKRLAFIARRAVELRFAVDLERMDGDMTLVEAPKQWANDVCNMQGIDYAKIRQPNPAEPIKGYELGQRPVPGDDFANQYIGDYVKKLEDFVASYPIEYPLKDGDDTAVVSLADDIFQVSAACSKPGRNLLYFSTEFGKNDSVTVTPDTRGWFVDGCGYSLPEGDGGADAGPGGAWNGCIAIASDALSPAVPDGGVADAGQPDASGYGMSREGLPGSSIPYRLRNQPCIPGTGPDGEPVPCPDVSSFVSRGSVQQWVVGLQPGHHVASIHALLDPEAVYVGDAGATPAAELRIVDENGGLVASASLAPLDAELWTRFEVPFQADGTSAYRFEIHPSNGEQVLEPPGDGGSPAWPGLYVAAAQVEKVGQQVSGQPATAAPWVRTDESRDVIWPLCHELKGPAFRKRFTRRCMYVCADGIKEDCPVWESKGQLSRCFYEAHFPVTLSEIEAGKLIPSGQIAIGNFNFRHNLAGINAIGTGLASCDGKPSSCYYNGFLEYTLVHSGNTQIRNYTGWNMAAKLDRAFVEHGKMLAAERIITNPPSSTDLSLLEPYMKHELKGRPMQGVYTLRVWDKPGLRWEQLEDLQLVWKYHYWTRFEKQ
jgi:hypothetical protein